MPASVDSTGTDQRVVEAAAVLPDDWGAVTGWAGLAWLRARWFDGSPWGGGPIRPVTLVVGGNRAIRPQPAYGIATSEERLLHTDVTLVDGLRVTHPARSVCFEMRYARDWRQAVTTLSMACYDDLVSIDEVAAYAAGLNGWTGIPMCRKALAFGSENSWSPREVDMLLAWTVDAALPRPLCNAAVFDLDGQLLGVPDLIDPVAGVVGEFNGAVHLAGGRRVRDLVREDVFRSHGLECVTMDAGDFPDSTSFLTRLVRAYDRAADILGSRRAYTVEPPAWWRGTTTVAARRALDAEARARLLRYRVA